MNVLNGPLWSRCYSDRVVQVWPTAHRCKCGQMHVLFVNKCGTTGCISCTSLEEVPNVS